MKALIDLLPITLSALLETEVCELRIRANKPVYCFDGAEWWFLRDGDGGRYVASVTDIEHILGVASGYSVYSVNDTIVRGFVAYEGGIRIGIAGEGVQKNGSLSTIKNISYLTIRIPKQVKACADDVFGNIYRWGKFKNTLIISPTAAGKTTMLREIARLTSQKGKNVLIIDERFELSATHKGQAQMDVGECTDVLCGVPKLTAYENAVRSMNPDVIVTDEVFSKAEIETLADAVRAGVAVAASLHGQDERVLNAPPFDILKEFIEAVIVLTKQPKAGTVSKMLLKRNGEFERVSAGQTESKTDSD